MSTLLDVCQQFGQSQYIAAFLLSDIEFNHEKDHFNDA